MANNGNTVNVEITASVDNLKKGLAKAEKGVKNFGGATDKLTKTTAKNTKGMVRGAVPALTSFSQVVQDAPYGIRGVANNIQQLTMQMGHLSANAGGTKNALKAMVGSLVGPAGILLAVSLVTSLLVSYGGELKKLMSKQADLNDAFKDASEGIGENITKLVKLTTAIDDTTLSESERKKLYDKIKKEYPQFLGKLDLEKVSRDKITTAINNERRAIIGLGITKALESKKAPLYAQIAEAELKSAEELLTASDKTFIYGIADPDTRIAFRKELAAKNKKATIDDAEKSLAEISKAAKGIIDKYGISTASILKLNGGSGGGGKEDDVKVFLGDIKSNLITFKEDVKALEIDKTLASIIPKTNQYALNFENLKKSFKDLVEDLRATADSGVVETVANMAFSIGDAIGKGANVMKAAGAAMLSTLGSILVQFGELTLAYGIANLALFKAITAGPNPISAGVAIAAGAALIAIGGAIKSFSANAIGGGGDSTSSDYASQSTGGSYNGSSTGYASGGSGGGRYVFEIAGTKLIGVLQNTLDRNKAFGGNITFG